MNVRNCVKCGRIFNYASGKPICANCKKELEVKFKEVKDYIKKNPDSTTAEVAESCEVDSKQIKQWVREERLTFSKDSLMGIDCEICGKTIKTGRYCSNCKSSMTKELQSAFTSSQDTNKEDTKENQAKESRMRFRDK